MTLLAIDTSEQACSVALLEGGAVVASASDHIGRGHAERLLPLIEEQLDQAGKSYANLSRIAVSTGPGTFTGLRIGLSVARGLALQVDVPCIGLTGLSVLAAQAMQAEGEDTVIHSLITGRGGQAFFQSFKGQDKDGTPKPVSDVAGLDIDDIATEISALGGSVIGSGVDLLIEAGHQDTLKAEGVSFNADRVISPMTLARLSAQLDPDAYPPEPTYFRAADAKKAKPALPTADRP